MYCFVLSLVWRTFVCYWCFSDSYSLQVDQSQNPSQTKNYSYYYHHHHRLIPKQFFLPLDSPMKVLCPSCVAWICQKLPLFFVSIAWKNLMCEFLQICSLKRLRMDKYEGLLPGFDFFFIYVILTGLLLKIFGSKSLNIFTSFSIFLFLNNRPSFSFKKAIVPSGSSRLFKLS